VNGYSVIVASSGLDERRELRSALEFEGYDVAEADTSAQTIQRACNGLHDVLLVDSVIDGVAAHAVCRAIRPRSELGIIVFDGGRRTNAIDALNAGADDYVAAPFVMAELVARVRAIMRRVTRTGGKQIVLQDRSIDLETHKIKGPEGRVSHLTPKEFLVLQCLIAQANQPRTHQSLAQTVWQRDGSGEVEYMRIVIRQLRRKLEPDPANPRYILTERSVGYRFHMPAAAAIEARQ